MEERRGSAAQLAGGDPLSAKLDQLFGTAVGSVITAVAFFAFFTCFPPSPTTKRSCTGK